MITTGILTIIYGIAFALTSPLRLLGDASLPLFISSSLEPVRSSLSSLDMVIPVDILLASLFFVLLFEAGKIAFEIFNWTLRRLPTQS